MGILQHKKKIDADKAKKSLAQAKQAIAADSDLLESFAKAAVFATAIADASFFLFDKYEQLEGRKFANISRIKSLLNQQSAGLDASDSARLSEKMGDVSDDIAANMKEWACENKYKCLAGAIELLEAASAGMDAALALLPTSIKCVTVSTKQLPELLVRAHTQGKLSGLSLHFKQEARIKVAEILKPKQ